MLLAAIDDVSVLDYDSMSRNDRRRVSGIAQQLTDDRHRAWLTLDVPDRIRAAQNLALIRHAMGS